MDSNQGNAISVIVADSATVVDQTFTRDSANPAICVVDGYGITFSMSSGRLVVQDGIGRSRRTRTFYRATHGLSRVVVLGSSGSLSLDAVAWCQQLGIAIVAISPDGMPTLSSTPRSTDDARLRRMQARAVDLPIGLDLSRSLIKAKLRGQAQVLAERFDGHDQAATIMDLAVACDGVSNLDELRQLEGTAAALYWQSWANRPECTPSFATRDASVVPPHWTRYEGRRSVLASANANRKAERPVNAILNYLYALVEIEAILACQVVGLDPGLGLLHTDTRSRASFALDLMEPIRPEVDHYVLDLLENRTFKKADFTETADGNCRLLAPLTHDLAETMPRWAKAIAPLAESVAHNLGRALTGKYIAATPLTKSRSKEAQAVVKARKATAKAVAESVVPRQRAVAASPKRTWDCPDCGSPVTNPRHVRCDACIDADPRQTKELRGRRGAAIAARKKTIREWDEANPEAPYEPEYFRREVLPGLANVKLADIMEAAGISKSFASEVRRGIYEPHVSTWGALRKVSIDSFSI
jgi:CRISPR-associated endonuclease Cas1